MLTVVGENNKNKHGLCALNYYYIYHLYFDVIILVWSQVQHGSGLINHMMIAIRSIGSPLISAIPVSHMRNEYSLF